MTTRVGDELHSRHMAGLERCIALAHELDCSLVNIMSGRKEMILWGSHGAPQPADRLRRWSIGSRKKFLYSPERMGV
ncbi:MAG TPA: hypothetical protein VLE23_19190 [Geminicoccaceae bacterium]|nr:hypothetical protein [Geminicoccaceae bacterium]